MKVGNDVIGVTLGTDVGRFEGFDVVGVKLGLCVGFRVGTTLGE